MAIRSWTDKELLQIYPVRTSRWFNSCALANYLTFTAPTIVKVLTASGEAGIAGAAKSWRGGARGGPPITIESLRRA